MGVLNFEVLREALKDILKELRLNYLSGEKEEKILAFTEAEVNKGPRKEDYVYFKPCGVVKIKKNCYIVFTEMQDTRANNIVFSITAFLITEKQGQLNYNKILLGINFRWKTYACNNFFDIAKLYCDLFDQSVDLYGMQFKVRTDIGAEANVKILTVLNAYINKWFDEIAEEEIYSVEKKGGLKVSCFVLEDLEKLM